MRQSGAVWQSKSSASRGQVEQADDTKPIVSESTEKCNRRMSRLRTTYADLGDIRLAYREYGNGPTLILLHGNSENKKTFEKHQLKHFKEYRTIAVDSRGHGQSISNDDGYSIRKYADDVVRMCEAIGIRESYLVGYSDGGNIALILASTAPQTFKKVVAISPNYLVSGVKEGYLRLAKAIVITLELLGRCGFPTRKSIMRFRLLLEDIGITDSELSNIQTSLKVLYAENDAIKEEHIQHIGRLVPGSTTNRIEKCNHLTILGKTSTIVQIKKFFAAP